LAEGRFHLRDVGVGALGKLWEKANDVGDKQTRNGGKRRWAAVCAVQPCTNVQILWNRVIGKWLQVFVGPAEGR
jgi:hypothetical protein